MNSIPLLPYPEIKAVNGTAKKLVVLIHGLGSDGHDLISLVPYIQKELSDAHFISPHGIEAFDMAPFGRQWFSLEDRDPNKIKDLVSQNAPLLSDIIKEKQVQLNLTNKDTILIGFSQGTMIGLYLNLIQTEPFYSMIGFSGRLIAPKVCINKVTPICLIHGELDDVVSIQELDVIDAYLSKEHIMHSTYRVKNLTHSIDAKGIEVAINFIKNVRG